MAKHERIQRDPQGYLDELFKTYFPQFKDEKIEEKTHEALTQTESKSASGKKS